MASYAKTFEGKPELQVLRALGYFDRPAEPDAIRIVLPKMDDQKYHAALVRLHKARLILGSRVSSPDARNDSPRRPSRGARLPLGGLQACPWMPRDLLT